MSGVTTQTAATSELLETNGEQRMTVIRWVYPLPARAPTWLGTSSLTLGRDEGCDVRLDGDRVSRRHASIRRSGSLWLLDDLDSKNGLFINARRSPGAALENGDVIRIGDFVGVVMEVPEGTDLAFGDLGHEICGGYRHRRAVEKIRAVATASIPVMLQGPTGTGKERFGRALHAWSGRAGAFLAVNCAAYSPAIAAAELFGHRKGAFTGAEQASPGHVRAAEGGTLMLDELADLPLHVQAMLLRVIENREVLAIGETQPRAIDVRFVAACQVPLSEATARGSFRPDLRARLEGAVIELPSLHDCQEIVPELFCELFLRHSGRAPELSAVAAERLCLHPWPLNIRELEMLARHLAATHASGAQISEALLEKLPRSAPSDAPPPRTAEPKPRKAVAVPGRTDSTYPESELRSLMDALTQCDGNVTKAAALLGLSRPRAYRMLEVAQRAGMVAPRGDR
ncbi:MAG TPA: sigma 54-interacting transcriptional regulator [Polyangiaceae bacterium]|nr:sigma 54-interacting transcriptional regulator [Polyangiaceae bacterium]